jgi:hypothetical protein
MYHFIPLALSSRLTSTLSHTLTMLQKVQAEGGNGGSHRDPRTQEAEKGAL